MAGRVVTGPATDNAVGVDQIFASQTGLATDMDTVSAAVYAAAAG